jgi:hypothetical protein
MEEFPPWHPTLKPLYAKHQDTHPSKIYEIFFSNALLGARSRS